MSYILDALKRADAARAREAAAVPDLHAQPEAGAGRRAASGPGGGVVAITAAVLLLATVAWWWFSATPTAMPPLPEATPAPTAPVMPPVAATATTRAAAEPTPPAAISATAPAVPVAVAPLLPRAARPPPLPKATTAPPTPAVVAASSSAAARVPTLAELPPDLRAQLPTLVVGGSVYSTSAASRMVILGGQVFREGGRPADGLVVEQIGPKSTVMSFRGQRFELRH
jgi:general secretion pathway protein B